PSAVCGRPAMPTNQRSRFLCGLSTFAVKLSPKLTAKTRRARRAPRDRTRSGLPNEGRICGFNRQSSLVNLAEALPDDLVEDDPRGNAYVVRAHFSTDRDARQEVAFLSHQAMHAGAFVPEDEGGRKGKIGFPQSSAGLRIQTGNPVPFFL